MKSARTKTVEKKNHSISRDLMVLSSLVTLVFSTSLTVDAFNPFKFAVLVLGVFYLYIRHWGYILSSLVSSRNFTILTLTFFSHSTLILAVNHYSISERLFGLQGRFFGFFSIWSLYLLGLVVFIAVKDKRLGIDSLLKCLLFTNLLVGLVFYIQELGIGFTEFQNDYTVLPSTLGNPNFLAAFVACSVFSGLYFLIAPRWKFNLNYWLAAASIISSIFIVSVANSLQGPLGIGLGAIVLTFLFSVRIRTKLTLLLTVLLSLVSIPLAQGLFGVGYLGDRLEQGTLVLRAMYWGIAGRMAAERPLFGQGFDSYLDNYREFRSPEEVLVYGTGLISDSPHNLYLDFLASGGFPYLLWALAGSCYVIFSATKILILLKLRGKESSAPAFLLSIWLVLTMLALINPFQLAVNIWNVVAGFAIAGYYHQLLGEGQAKLPLKEDQVKNWTLVKIPIALSLIFFVNPLVAVTPMATEIRFRTAVEKSDYKALRSVALDWPFSGSRVAAISQGIVNSSLRITSTADLEIDRQLQYMIRSANADALAATRINEKSFELWRFIFYNNPDPLVIERAREALKRLDPQDPSWVTAKP